MEVLNLYVIRFFIAIVLGLLGLIIITTNWIAIIRYKHNNEVHFSLIPILGGVSFCISFVVITDNPYRWLCWIAFLLDVGCLPMIIGALIRKIVNKK